MLLIPGANFKNQITEAKYKNIIPTPLHIRFNYAKRKSFSNMVGYKQIFTRKCDGTFSPLVKYVLKPKRLYVDHTNEPKPPSGIPKDFR